MYASFLTSSHDESGLKSNQKIVFEGTLDQIFGGQRGFVTTRLASASKFEVRPYHSGVGLTSHSNLILEISTSHLLTHLIPSFYDRHHNLPWILKKTLENGSVTTRLTLPSNPESKVELYRSSVSLIVHVNRAKGLCYHEVSLGLGIRGQTIPLGREPHNAREWSKRAQLPQRLASV